MEQPCASDADVDLADMATRIRTLLAAPFIYVMIVPLVILDVFVEIYQRVVFRCWERRRVAP